MDLVLPDRHFVSLQILRGLAALGVVGLHCAGEINTVIPSMPYSWTLNGAAGVDTFFILSGFVIELTIRQFRANADGWRRFAWHRFARIAPLYWALTGIKVLVAAVIPSAMRAYSIVWPNVLASFFLIPFAAGNDKTAFPVLVVGWTLMFEMLFYIVATISLAFRTPLLRTSAAVLIPLAFISLFQPEWPIWLNFYAHPFVLEFLVGIVIARLTLKGWVLPPLVAGASIVAGLLFIGLVPGTADQTTRLILFGIPGTLFVAGFVGLERFARIQQFKPLAILGNASYAIYLIHTQIVAVLIIALKSGFFADVNPFVLVAGTVAFCIIAGIAIFYWFEKPVKKVLLGFLSPETSPGYRREFGKI